MIPILSTIKQLSILFFNSHFKIGVRISWINATAFELITNSNTASNQNPCRNVNVEVFLCIMFKPVAVIFSIPPRIWFRYLFKEPNDKIDKQNIGSDEICFD